MRSIEYLVSLFPEKTGLELLEIQKQDKLDDEKKFNKLNKKKLDFINDINTNGGYYYGRFGVDQYYFYRVFNMILDNNEIYTDVETLVVFINQEGIKHQVTGKGDVNLERRIKTYQKCSEYDLDERFRVSIKEWNEVNEYVNNITKFWENIKAL